MKSNKEMLAPTGYLSNALANAPLKPPMRIVTGPAKGQVFEKNCYIPCQPMG